MLKYFFITAFFIFNIKLLPAQESSPDTIMLSLQEAINLGLEDNKNLRQDILNVSKAEYQIKDVKSGYWPNVSISGSYTRNIKRPVFFLPSGDDSPFGSRGGVIEAGFDNSYMATAQATIPIFNQQLFANADVAEISEKLSKQQVEVNKTDLRAQIKKIYFQTLLAQESVDVLQESLDNAVNHLENVRNMYQQGLAPEFDVLRAEVEAENIRPDLIAAINDYNSLKNQLKLLLSIPVEEEIKLERSLIYYYELQEQEGSLANYSITDNPQIKQLKLQRDMQNQQIEVEEAAYYPTLSAFGNYQYQAQANDFNFGDYRWVETSAAGIRFNIPVFSGLRRDSRIEIAQIELERISLQEEYLQDNLTNQAINVIDDIVQAKKRIEVQEANIKKARRSYQIALASYQKGGVTILEVNDAELALTQARMGYIRAINDYLTALAEYERITDKNVLELSNE